MVWHRCVLQKMLKNVSQIFLTREQWIKRHVTKYDPILVSVK